MNFYKNIFFIYVFLALAASGAVSAADDVEELLKVDEEELPLNNPFDGTKGSNVSSNSTAASINNSSEELENPMSLNNFKLVGIIAGKDQSFISLVNQDGETRILKNGEELYDGFQLVNLKLNEAVFKKEDNTFVTINFQNQIKEVKE
ncbi:hypothetical protein N8700_00555 [Candidatus Pelagibacter sp.]|nr:hypothetical protein [Candidatus Pelagibacter sp.]